MKLSRKRAFMLARVCFYTFWLVALVVPTVACLEWLHGWGFRVCGVMLGIVSVILLFAAAHAAADLTCSLVNGEEE